MPAPPFFFPRSGAPRDLHSFATRRSSDLTIPDGGVCADITLARGAVFLTDTANPTVSPQAPGRILRLTTPRAKRSEEHTSELQSHVNLVCRLLLEKKKPRLVADRDRMSCA